ncbi:Fc.00g105190.m01.CDS01 [Cosmosporella sp. VM-42]
MRQITPVHDASKSLSLVQGPTTPELYIRTLGSIIRQQTKRFGDRIAVKAPWQSVQLTYRELGDRSVVIAKAILGMGLKHGECVGVMAGNCHQYLEIFLGASRIGCPVVAINNTFSPEELQTALSRSNAELKRIVILGETAPSSQGIESQTYNAFVTTGLSSDMDSAVLDQFERKVDPADVLNLQFTSGTTGLPKAASLTHINLINDARFVGNAMRLTEEDIVCCPPPLFHCFGLVMGFLSSFCYGSCIVFPSDNFNAEKTIHAVVNEKVTALLGVPTMFYAEMEALEKTQLKITTVRTGLAAGSSIPRVLMESLHKNMKIQGMLIAYGMTETSPVTFITSLDDPAERMFNSIGRVFPHTGAKVIDSNGNIVPLGVRGELCTSGFALQRGYWKDEARTKEVMKEDDNGIVWMHTGDEAFIDSEGYGHITGRIKDIIIRGGENLSPAEIENRLLAHPAIGECCVVGLTDQKYGEVVSCFLKPAGETQTRIHDDEVRSWVKQRLGPVKAPQHIFWVGEPEIGHEIPKTGSGKHQKHIVRGIGNGILKQKGAVPRPKL